MAEKSVREKEVERNSLKYLLMKKETVFEHNDTR